MSTARAAANDSSTEDNVQVTIDNLRDELIERFQAMLEEVNIEEAMTRVVRVEELLGQVDGNIENKLNDYKANLVSNVEELFSSIETRLKDHIAREVDRRVAEINNHQDRLFNNLRVEVDDKLAIREEEERRMNGRIDESIAQSLRRHEVLHENVQAVDADLQDEKNVRAEADRLLGERVDREVAERQAHDEELANQLAEEARLREAGDVALGDRIVAEENTRTREVQRLDERINAEERARTAADTALERRVTEERNQRGRDVQRLDGRIDTEERVRHDADANLQTQINEITRRVDPIIPIPPRNEERIRHLERELSQEIDLRDRQYDGDGESHMWFRARTYHMFSHMRHTFKDVTPGRDNKAEWAGIRGRMQNFKDTFPVR